MDIYITMSKKYHFTPNLSLPNTGISNKPADQLMVERLLDRISQLHTSSFRQVFAWKTIAHGLSGCDGNEGC